MILLELRDKENKMPSIDINRTVRELRDAFIKQIAQFEGKKLSL